MVDGELLTDVGELKARASEWDELAVEAGRPYCTPAWQLAWWRHAAPANALLRAIVVRDGDAVIGIAPLYVSREAAQGSAYRFLAAPHSSPVEPLARPGREADVASVLGEWLPRLTPAPDSLLFEGVPADSVWPSLVASAWNGSVAPLVERSVPAPAVDCSASSFDEWLATRSGHFRKRLRSRRRRIEGRGAAFVRATTPEAARGALETFAALHRKRWARKEMEFVDERLERMLVAAAAADDLVAAGRLRVWSLTAGHGIVAVEVLLAAGGTVSSWQGSFDEAWASEQPSLQTLVAALEDAFASGDQLFDLGPGGQDFKYRLADRETEVRWLALIPRGRGYALRRARRTALRVRPLVASKVPPRQKALAKRLVRRFRP